MAKTRAIKAATKTEPKELIITRLIEQTKWRFRQNIDTWRGAIVLAENVIWPNRVPLYTLYDEVILDSHIEGIIGQRRDALLAEKFKLTDANDEPLDDIQAMFENEWFYDFLEFSLESRWWGHSLIQLFDPIPGEGYGGVMLVPRRHVMPEFGTVSVMQGDYVNAIPYRVPPYSAWLIEVGRPKDHGLLKIAAPDFIIKKNAKMNWAEYTEIFGMPVRVGTTASRNQGDIDRMAENLKKMGAAAYGVFQQGEDIKFIESTKGDAYNVYDKLIERSNSELSKLIIRQTMTIEDGSSRSQGEVHERMLETLKEADKRMLKFTVKKLLKNMVLHGLVPEGTKYDWEVTIDLESLWKKVQGSMAFYNVDLSWVEDTFGIPLEVRPESIIAVGQGLEEDESEGEKPEEKTPAAPAKSKPTKKKA